MMESFSLVEPGAEENTAPQKKRLSKKSLTCLTAGALAVIAGVVLIIASLCGGSWQSTLDKYVNALKRQDWKTINKLIYPDEVVQGILKYNNITLSDYNEELDRKAETYVERFVREYVQSSELAGDHFSYDEIMLYVDEAIDNLYYEVCRVDETDNEYLEYWNEYLNDLFDLPKDYIEEIKIVYVRYTTNAGDKTYTDTQVYHLQKVKGRWYINTTHNVLDWD